MARYFPQCFRRAACPPFCLAALLAASPAQAQHTGGGPPSQDPWGHPAAAQVPGGRYLSHKAVWEYDTVRSQVTRVLLDVRQQQYAALLFVGLQRLHKTHIVAKAEGTYPGAATQRLVQLRVAGPPRPCCWMGSPWPRLRGTTMPPNTSCGCSLA